MQIFRPYASHRLSARYLCDLRLNKQVLECSQVAASILIHMNLLDGRGGYFRHPITQAVWNEGKPYLPDLYCYMRICDREWIRRGKQRSGPFTDRMLQIKHLIQEHRDRFEWAPMPAIFVSGDVRETRSDRVFPLYQQLLSDKWRSDRKPAKISLRRPRSI